ncbi:hypothetical protein [Paraliomyxa miuraensis]|uniref:hypothetical protein n=1 Tax=Paraliomyxa miuraensis TaxID=376150 RepID=UPI00225BF070|nr:hypothetical protein [Paraliomyxa miuraensis]MCX4245938.1 hypothetical protein [Paraliomyxa miuraensis]
MHDQSPKQGGERDRPAQRGEVPPVRPARVECGKDGDGDGAQDPIDDDPKSQAVPRRGPGQPHERLEELHGLPHR